ncbi:methyltransferase type 11 [Mycobacterium simiae]|uniref:methyltransferase type 11 n=1 Tax=Mycobacterium simiae TaxID=1784 RepID=UPI00041853A7|nr:methyltransferase type 11 [Mycobacterium simiae]PLV44251.1 hemolytic protein HlpA-like protein [Mycobacterium tuberculosis variant microti OV254]
MIAAKGRSVPVIFIIFNRPDNTRQVFEAIRAAKPAQLLVIADGPREDRPGEPERCAITRAIVDEVDWDCQVHKNFAESNMGCQLRISSGISWAFTLVDEAIILEDDCVPSSSFFIYCAELLDRYANDERVMMVSGRNHLFGRMATDDSYYFSRYPHVWGWATWRRAWEKYDAKMSDWPEIRDRKIFDQYFSSILERYYRESILQYVYDGKINTWAYQWFYAIWANSGLCATPARNLVRNIGFDTEATNTKWDLIYSAHSALAAEDLELPLKHPATVLASSDRDELEARLQASRGSGLLHALNKYISVLRVLLKRTTGIGEWPNPGLLVRGGG